MEYEERNCGKKFYPVAVVVISTVNASALKFQISKLKIQKISSKVEERKDGYAKQPTRFRALTSWKECVRVRVSEGERMQVCEQRGCVCACACVPMKARQRWSCHGANLPSQIRRFFLWH